MVALTDPSRPADQSHGFRAGSGGLSFRYPISDYFRDSRDSCVATTSSSSGSGSGMAIAPRGDAVWASAATVREHQVRRE